MRIPRLVFVTQLMDPADPVLGFSVGWMRALAARCERLVVIANEVRHVPADLNAEVLSLGKERGARRSARLARYLGHLERVLWRGHADALFAHMCPQYLNAAAPLLALHRVPGMLWFAHPQDSRSLRFAERAAAVVLTSFPGAFPFASPKVRVIGQAIDLSPFSECGAPTRTDVLRALALGRLSPAKGFATMIVAVAKLRAEGVPVGLRIVGPATTPTEESHSRDLHRLAADVGPVVTIDPPVEHREVARVLTNADVLVNGMRAGSGDKVALEAMAARRLAVWSNPCFDGLGKGLPLRLRYREDDPDDLAAVLRQIWQAPHEVRLRVGEVLARRAGEAHSLDGWADRVIEVVCGLKEAM